MVKLGVITARHAVLRFGAAVLITGGVVVSGSTASVASINSNTIFDNIRYSNGDWQGWGDPAQPPQQLRNLSSAALPNGSLFLAGTGTTSAQLVYVIRSSDGSWSPWKSVALPSADPEWASAAALPDGDVHVDLISGDQSTISDNVLYTNGNWQGWASPTEPPGQEYGVISSAALPDGELHVDVTSWYNNARLIWDNVRYTNGKWQGWVAPSQPPGNGIVSLIADAAEPNGQLHIEATAEQGVGGPLMLFDDIRYADGTWQGWREPLQPVTQHSGNTDGEIQELAATGMPDGDMQIAAEVIVDGKGILYHDIRFADGSWQVWGQPALPPVVNGSGDDVAIAGMPDGSVHVDIQEYNVDAT
jgi:hypothetical protein